MLHLVVRRGDALPVTKVRKIEGNLAALQRVLTCGDDACSWRRDMHDVAPYGEEALCGADGSLTSGDAAAHSRPTAVKRTRDAAPHMQSARATGDWRSEVKELTRDDKRLRLGPQATHDDDQWWT